MKLKENIIFLSGLIISFASACSSSTGEDTARKKAPVVQVSIKKPSINADHSISVAGQIESVHTASISTRIMGFITGIKVKAGDPVSKGQLLITISNEDILAKMAQADAMISGAQASLNSAEKDYQRFTNLYNQKSASAKELDDAALQYQAAKAGLQSAMQMKAEARAMLAYTNITAPFSGVVAQKLADAGSLANPGMPILVIEQDKSLQVSAVIPETEISRIQLRSDATVSVKPVNKTFKGTVAEISPSSIATGGQYIVKIDLPPDAQNSLRAGMYAHINIIAKDQLPVSDNESVLVPLSAIDPVGQLDALYTLSHNNTALLRYVQLGKTYGDYVEVLSGLGSEERFIASADGKLYNGVPVKVKTQN